jgi:polyribonucleotide nucleotidyltransferase
MNLNPITQIIEMPNGDRISMETGKLAKQADGSVVVRQGDTMILATVVAAKQAKEGQSFFPLSVEFKEKFSAAGRFPGGFLKREARPGNHEILNCRLIDRAIRPLFPEGFMNETQVILSVISYDENVNPDTLGCLGAAAALAVSDIPFNGPVSEVKVGRLNGEFLINPSDAQLAECDINMIIAASEDNVMMVEGQMQEVSEAEMIEAINFGHEAIKVQVKAMNELAAQVEKAKVKREVETEEINQEVYDKVKAHAWDPIYNMVKEGINDKSKRKEILNEVIETFLEGYSDEELSEYGNMAKSYFNKVQKEAIRTSMLDNEIRLDGRKNNEIRGIWGEVDYLPSTHGSSVFTRGETQALASLTLGSSLNEQATDGVSVVKSEKFYLHYNFPPFCTGEAKPMRGTSRREIGHGNLAQRALEPVVPTGEANPYTIRLISDVLESNGSSSMATVCAGTMALMDAGIKIKSPVSGIAMGMVAEDNGRYMILSDILGDEDHLGDMDFKVTGTEKGVTACQMDIKVDGLSSETLAEALNQAKEGRLHILGEMKKVIAEPASDVKAHSPRIQTMEVPGEFIGAIIGPGGKHIQELQKDTNCNISISEIEGKDAGIVELSGSDKEGMARAIKHLEGVIAIPEKGTVYEGKIKSIVSFGAFVEILPGKQGLLHISEIDHKRVNDVADELNEGDMVKVKLLDIDKQGKLKLSRRALLPKPEKKEAPAAK